MILFLLSTLSSLLFVFLSLFLRALRTASWAAVKSGQYMLSEDTGKGSHRKGFMGKTYFGGLKWATRFSDVMAVSGGFGVVIAATVSLIAAGLMGGVYTLLLSDGVTLSSGDSQVQQATGQGGNTGPIDPNSQAVPTSYEHPGLVTRQSDVGYYAAQALMNAYTPEVQARANNPNEGWEGLFMYINETANPRWGYSCVSWVQAAYHSIGLRLDGSRVGVDPYVFGVDEMSKVNNDRFPDGSWGTWGSSSYNSKPKQAGVLMDFQVSRDGGNWDLLRPGDILRYPGHVLMYIGIKDGIHWTSHAVGNHVDTWCTMDINDKNCNGIGYYPLENSFFGGRQYLDVVRVSEATALAVG